MFQPHPERVDPKRVLIVEDEKRLRDLLHTSITEMGLMAATAGSGEAADWHCNSFYPVGTPLRYLP